MTQCDQTLARWGGCMAAPSRVTALCPGGGVQADRGRGGQVEALRLPVYRHRDRLVVPAPQEDRRVMAFKVAGTLRVPWLADKVAGTLRVP